MKSPHNFKDDLDYSLTESQKPYWLEIYKKAFPNFKARTLTVGYLQQKGVDSIIHLEGYNKPIYVDEKVQRKKWNCICCEYISNNKTGTKGWIEKPLYTDYLAYCFEPTKECYFFDFRFLQKAWSENKEEWKKKYRIIAVPNTEYETISCLVPITEIQKAMTQCFVVKF